MMYQDQNLIWTSVKLSPPRKMFLIICLISADKYRNFKPILMHICYYTYLDIVDVMVVQIHT